MDREVGVEVICIGADRCAGKAVQRVIIGALVPSGAQNAAGLVYPYPTGREF